MEHMDIDVKHSRTQYRNMKGPTPKNGEGTEKREEETTNLDTNSYIHTTHELNVRMRKRPRI